MKYLLSDIASIVGGTLHGRDREVSDVVTDSRVSAGKETLFVAMRGENHDSHNYISQMVGRGVETFLVERDDVEALHGNTSYIVVERAIPALQKLAAHHRSKFEGEVVAITGSNGKTTIKEWVAQLAPEGVKIFRSPRSYNSQLGVALSLLMIEGDEDVAIIEAGISRTNEMAKLEAMIRPDTVVITSIGDAHQEGFESIEQKIEEKMVLAKGAKRVIFNSAYTELIPHLIYGKWQTIDAESAESTIGDEAMRRNTQIVETLFHTLGFARPSFESIRPLAMRLEMIEGLSGSMIINDSYNSDINSLTIALDTLNANASGRPTTIILSEILQSGRCRAELYQKVAEAIQRAGVNRIIGVGQEISASRELFPSGSKFFTTTEELMSNLTTADYEGRALLLKGNRESRFETISHRLARQSHTTTLEVNLDAMVENLNHFRSHLSPTTKLVAMVKASSYGAGEEEVSRVLQHQGVDYLAVAFADEGSRLRERGVTMPIIVLNADDGSFSQMVDMRLEPEIYSIRSLRQFAAAVASRGERSYPIHIKLDSGMHRLGFMEGQIEELLEVLDELSDEVKVASIFSHLAQSDMGDTGRESTLAQCELFGRVSGKITSALPYSVIRHLANSAAIIHYPEAHFDMCRLGIGLYGFGEEGLRPISTLKSRIVQIREIESNECVGYGGCGVVEHKSRIATIPIGYADGIDRHLGGGAWSVLVGGGSAPTIGRICMDSLMIDITDLPETKEGDEVVIFSEREGNTAADMAAKLETISYEVLTSVSTRVKRIYIKE